MTSQGLGEPFAPGEKLMGYQACGLKGKVYIGLDDIYEEKLMSISEKDEAVFRYVKSDKPWTGVQINCAGSGVINILMNGEEAGLVTVEGQVNTFKTVMGEIIMVKGEYELTLQFKQANHLEIAEIILLAG